MNPTKIKTENGTTLVCAKQPVATQKNVRGELRDVIILTFADTSYDLLLALFEDGAKFSVLSWGETKNVSGLPSREFAYIEHEKHDYCVAGDITDHRDGTFTVTMGKKTEIELLEEENASLLFENLTGEAF